VTPPRTASGPSSSATPAAAERRGGAPEPVGDVLRRILREVRPEHRRRKGVAEAWSAAAGPELAEETRPATLQRGVLVVEVRSTALLAELQGFRRDELLARLLAAEPSGRITGLRFRPGVF
jgi:predicted nucleic acid-binding Zn ribbon protein